MSIPTVLQLIKSPLLKRKGLHHKSKLVSLRQYDKDRMFYALKFKRMKQNMKLLNYMKYK